MVSRSPFSAAAQGAADRWSQAFRPKSALRWTNSFQGGMNQALGRLMQSAFRPSGRLFGGQNPFASGGFSFGNGFGGGGFGLRSNPFAPQPTNFNLAQMSMNIAMDLDPGYYSRPNPMEPDSGEGTDFEGQGRGLSGAMRWKDMAQRVAREVGIPWEVIIAIMGIESGGENIRDPHGAVGLMQIMPQYWQSLANKYGGDLMDPYTNIRVGAEILKSNYERYGSWELAAAAYLGSIERGPDGSWRPGTATDAYGTSGKLYVDLFNENLYALGYGRQTPGESNTSHYRYTLVTDMASRVIGQPYRWGGESFEEGGFDCSGLVHYFYGKYLGVNIGRTAQDQYNNTRRIGQNELRPGDLVFYTRTYAGAPTVSHVGIYMGNGQVLMATSEGDIVRYVSLNDPWWSKHIYGYGALYRGPSGW